MAPISRRQALASALVGLRPKTAKPVAGGFVNESAALGHRLRDRAQFPPPARTERVPIVIVGGGIAGLSAAWRLSKRGFHDYVALEMEPEAGGNARWGGNEVSEYPWAAHYLPLPNPEADLVRELCEEMGLLRDGEWDERHLCHSPQERLFLHGRWQEGLEPEVGVPRAGREQYRRFADRIEEFRASGEFTVPSRHGLRKGARRHDALDRLTMAEWMRREGFDSPYLAWYVDYACRDDYGGRSGDTSAWAGVHYFASRAHEDKGPLTWPEGNGRIVKHLMGRVGPRVRRGETVWRIAADRTRVRVLTTRCEYIAEAVVYAAPAFLAPYLMEPAPAVRGLVYSPWLTANLTLDRWPAARGLEPAWDNVIYGSPSLGYVVATHQSLRSRIDRTVWTYYWALGEGSPAAMRATLLQRDWDEWKELILTDLERAHKDIRGCVSRIDIMRLGHAMPRPVPGFLTASWRRALGGAGGPVYFAGSDTSGFPLFEEAQSAGVAAAMRALARVSKA